MSFYHLLVYTNIQVHKKKIPIPSRWSKFIGINKYFIIFLKIWTVNWWNWIDGWMITLFSYFTLHIILNLSKDICLSLSIKLIALSLCAVSWTIFLYLVFNLLFFSLVVFNQMIKPCSEFLFQWLFYNSTKLIWLFF